MSSRETTDEKNIGSLIEEIDLILSKDFITQEEESRIVNALELHKDFRVFIAERIVKSDYPIEDKILNVLLKSEDPDLLVHCSLILMIKGRNIGALCLLRAIISQHPLEIIIAQRLAQQNVDGLSQALCISLRDRPSLFFPKFIQLVYILFGVDRVSAKSILKEYIVKNKDVDLRFYDKQIKEILT